MKEKTKKYSSPLTHRYEINFKLNKTVSWQIVDDKTIPQVEYNFVPIVDLKKRSFDSYVDVMGIIMDWQEQRETRNKWNKEKATLLSNATIYDESRGAITVSFWEDIVSDIETLFFYVFGFNLYIQIKSTSLIGRLTDGDVLCLKNCIVSKYNGVSLSCGNNSVVLVNPRNLKEFQDLKAWKLRHPKMSKITQLSD